MKYLFLKGLFMAEQRNQTPAGDNTQWTTVIRPRTGWFDVDLEELWRYRDLIVMFVKRNFTVMYKQTILGPLWIILNPLITTILFNVVFGGIAGLSTDGTPSFFVLHGRQHGVDLFLPPASTEPPIPLLPTVRCSARYIFRGLPHPSVRCLPA